MLDKILIHPQIDPVAIHLGSFGIHWYGLMYLTGFLGFLFLGKYQIKHKPWFGWNVQMLDDALFYGALGVILGGRLGYVLFYQLGDYIQHPLDIFKVWQGGMSFHGGFLGVLITMFFFNKNISSLGLKSWISSHRLFPWAWALAAWATLLMVSCLAARLTQTSA